MHQRSAEAGAPGGGYRLAARPGRGTLGRRALYGDEVEKRFHDVQRRLPTLRTRQRRQRALPLPVDDALVALPKLRSSATRGVGRPAERAGAREIPESDGVVERRPNGRALLRRLA